METDWGVCRMVAHRRWYKDQGHGGSLQFHGELLFYVFDVFQKPLVNSQQWPKTDWPLQCTFGCEWSRGQWAVPFRWIEEKVIKGHLNYAGQYVRSTLQQELLNLNKLIHVNTINIQSTLVHLSYIYINKKRFDILELSQFIHIYKSLPVLSCVFFLFDHSSANSDSHHFTSIPLDLHVHSCQGTGRRFQPAHPWRGCRSSAGCGCPRASCLLSIYRERCTESQELLWHRCHTTCPRSSLAGQKCLE